jgi:hypothetical protein
MPTLAGVPVATTSPESNVMTWLMRLSRVATREDHPRPSAKLCALLPLMNWPPLPEGCACRA